MTSTVQELKVGTFINLSFPSVNKNDSLTRNDEEINRRSYVELCKILRVIDLCFSDWVELSHNLLSDRKSFWGKIGGQDLSPTDNDAFTVLCRESGVDSNDYWSWVGNEDLHNWFRTHSYTNVVAVTCEGYPPFFVNTEGYDYARYVGRIA